MLPDHDAVLELTIEVLHKVNYSFFSLLYCSSYFHFEYSIVGMGLEVLRFINGITDRGEKDLGIYSLHIGNR